MAMKAKLMWEDAFESLYDHIDGVEARGQLKTFIRQAIDEAVKAERKRLLEKVSHTTSGGHFGMTQCMNCGGKDIDECRVFDIGFTAALSVVQTLLTDKL